ncbi:hypothetical protein RCO48_37595 [Peribacillus frigoritolerans]|nr:hypothetical protein [Peribacillus frigoritolerans]
MYRELGGHSLIPWVPRHSKKARQRTVLAMKHAEDTLLAGFSSRQSRDALKRLYLLNEHANAIFLEALEISLNKKNQDAARIRSIRFVPWPVPLHLNRE